ncbi:MAG: hybrid sensor histidine kinase/response regulator, partial [Legionella sp.]
MIKNKTIVMSQSDFSSQGELFALTETAFIVLDKQLVLHYYNEYAARLCELPKEFSSSIQLTSPFYTLPIPNPIIDTHGELISENKNSAHYWIKINLLVNKKTYIGLVRKKKTTDFLSKNKLLQKIEKKLGYIPKKITTENDVIDVLSLHYQSIIDKLPYYIYWKNTQSEYQGCNKMTRKLLGLNSPKEIIGKTDIDFFGSTELAYKFQDQDKEVFLSKKSLINVKEDLKNNQGVLMNTLINKVPLFHGDEVIGLVGVTIDVTELVQAKKLAEAANLAKTEFIANMSHDIRTPLTGVIGLSEILEQTLQNPEEKEKAHLLHDSGEELLHMLNDILDDVRAGNLKETDLKEEAFSLHQCIKDLIRLQSPATTLKGLALKADIAAN